MEKLKFISLNDWLLEQEGKKKEKKEQRYGCVMMDSKIDDWEEYHLSGIDRDDIYEKPNDDSYGLEDQPHVTVIYGIHEDEIDEEIIAQVIRENMKPLTLSIDEIDIFEGDEYDVVKYNVPKDKILLKYRELFIKNFPNTQKFSEYNPHITIAYVKPGRGKKYKRKIAEPFSAEFTKGVYSYHDDPKDPDSLKRKVINLQTDIDKNDNRNKGKDKK